ncbi:MAG: hypothetical protein KKG04_01550 [Candidatus Thermoplasmatota archaeon]|nr:hypothetical protein [Candidatus Thermoplasmatota archaeon]
MKQQKDPHAKHWRIEQLENAWKRISERRIKSIQNSMIRPLYQEIIKMIFYVFVTIFNSLLLLQILIESTTIIIDVIYIMVLTVVSYLEYRVYAALWGKKGRWSLIKNYEKIENIS